MQLLQPGKGCNTVQHAAWQCSTRLPASTGLGGGVKMTAEVVTSLQNCPCGTCSTPPTQLCACPSCIGTSHGQGASMPKGDPRTLARDSCRSSARTREAPAALLLTPGGSRQRRVEAQELPHRGRPRQHVVLRHVPRRRAHLLPCGTSGLVHSTWHDRHRQGRELFHTSGRVLLAG